VPIRSTSKIANLRLGSEALGKNVFNYKMLRSISEKTRQIEKLMQHKHQLIPKQQISPVNKAIQSKQGPKLRRD
jgi:hypothetical protein